MPRRQHTSGFVYIWFDRKHKRYYVGSHWGAEDDGYICSSTWMRNAYNYRPDDFKRRILQRINTNKYDLHEAEHRWLQMMKIEELKGVRYYNQCNTVKNHWMKYPEGATNVKKRISASSKGMIVITNGVNESKIWPTDPIPDGWYRGHSPRKVSEATKKKISEGLTGFKRPYKPRPPRSPETYAKIGEALRGRKHPPVNPDVKRRISESMKAYRLKQRS